MFNEIFTDLYRKRWTVFSPVEMRVHRSKTTRGMTRLRSVTFHLLLYAVGQQALQPTWLIALCWKLAIKDSYTDMSKKANFNKFTRRTNKKERTTKSEGLVAWTRRSRNLAFTFFDTSVMLMTFQALRGPEVASECQTVTPSRGGSTDGGRTGGATRTINDNNSSSSSATGKILFLS